MKVTLHVGRLRAYSQTLQKAGMACQGLHCRLFAPFFSHEEKSLIKMPPELPDMACMIVFKFSSERLNFLTDFLEMILNPELSEGHAFQK